MQRQISKTPQAPHIDEELKQLLTELCFAVENPLEAVDLMFVYGTPFSVKAIAYHISQLLETGLVHTVLLTGGLVHHKELLICQKSEASLIYKELNLNKDYSHIRFFLEEKSQNTLENVTEGLKIFNFSDCKRICFISASHCARRSYLTLRKYFPQGELIQSTYNASYPEDVRKLSKDNWYTFDFGIRRIWGEFLRIKEYGRRGDIAYHDVIDLVDKIDKYIPVSLQNANRGECKI